MAISICILALLTALSNTDGCMDSWDDENITHYIYSMHVSRMRCQYCFPLWKGRLNAEKSISITGKILQHLVYSARANCALQLDTVIPSETRRVPLPLEVVIPNGS